MIDLSICIPTYNRAKMLRQCLEYLAGFAERNFELLIGDNASGDDTPEVVAALRNRFPHFAYLRHDSNLGFARNMDALLRRATRKYAYILSDDDLVFEDALRLCISLLDNNPEVVAVSGKYLNVSVLDTQMHIDFSRSPANRITRGSHAYLIDNIPVMDGHPILRRAVFERHCALLDRTGMMMTLYFELLRHGDIVVLDKPILQHRTTNDSVTGRMAEASFVDMGNADIEIAVSGCAGSLPPDALVRARKVFLFIVYLQAARMSFNRREPYLLWLFLRRLMGIQNPDQTLGEEFLLKCEHYFSNHFLMDRVYSILKGVQFRRVHFLDTAVIRTVVADLSRGLPNVEFVALGRIADVPPDEVVLCEEYTERSTAAAKLIALYDLFDQVRLTRRAARLDVDGARLVPRYADEDVAAKLMEPSPTFQILCDVYNAQA